MKGNGLIIVIGLILLALALINQQGVKLSGESVSVVNGQIKIVVPLSNPGTTTQQYVLEAQVYDEAKKASSTALGTCDNACPFNVYTTVTLAPQTSEQVIIYVPKSGKMPDGKYHVKMVSVTSCCPQSLGTCAAEGPYGWGQWITETPVVVGSGVQQLSDLCVTEWCGDGECNGAENTGTCSKDCGAGGDACTDSDGGINPVAFGNVNYAMYSASDGCENVANTNLWERYCETPFGPIQMVKIDCNDFTYTNMGQTIHKTGYVCSNGVCVPPAPVCTPNCNCAANTCIGTPCRNSCNTADCPGTKTCTSETASASLVNGKIHVTVPVKNTGSSQISYLLEAQVSDRYKKQSSTAASTCNSNCPYNVHKVVTLAAGASETVTIDIPASGTMPNGQYHVSLVSADSCCNTNPSCALTGPYSSAQWITTTPIVVGTGVDAVADLCQTNFCGDGTCDATEASLNSGQYLLGQYQECSDCGTCQCSAWTACENNVQTRTCSSGTRCSPSQTCTPPIPDTPFDWNKYLPFIIGFVVLIVGVKVMGRKK